MNENSIGKSELTTITIQKCDATVFMQLQMQESIKKAKRLNQQEFMHYVAECMIHLDECRLCKATIDGCCLNNFRRNDGGRKDGKI